jgi:hypothetical protein
MPKSAADIIALLKANASITALVQPSYIFDYEQVENRRFFPSIEVVLINPESTNRTDEADITTYSFEIRIYQRRAGILSDEISFFDTIEPLVVTTLVTNTLQDHRISLEAKSWERKTNNRFAVSTIRARLVQIVKPSVTPDATLTFKVNGSDVNNYPASDYSYIAVNTEVSYGYGTAEIGIPSDSGVPAYFSTTFRGIFSTDIIITNTDIGSTGDKLNKIALLKTASLEHQTARLIYVNKTNIEGFQTVTNDIKVIVNEVRFLYKADVNIVYRVSGRLIEAPTLTTP